MRLLHNLYSIYDIATVRRIAAVRSIATVRDLYEALLVYLPHKKYLPYIGFINVHYDIMNGYADLYFEGLVSSGLKSRIDPHNNPVKYFAAELFLKRRAWEIRNHPLVLDKPMMKPKISIPYYWKIDYFYDHWMICDDVKEMCFDYDDITSINCIDNLMRVLGCIIKNGYYPGGRLGNHDEDGDARGLGEEYIENIKRELQEEIERRQREKAARTIQRHFLKCYYHPEFKFCRDRLSREYDKFFAE